MAVVVSKGQSQLRFECEYCQKKVTEKSRYRFGNYWSVTFDCGHSSLIDALEVVEADDTGWLKFKSIDGRQLYNFQKEGASFAIEANGRCLIADEMGLGKTVQALAFLWWLFNKKPKSKALVVTKSTLKYQWSHEAYRFLGEKLGMNQIIENKNQKPLTEFGFNIVIVSFDMLRRCEWIHDEAFMKDRFETVIIDETQNIKNPTAQRTAMVRRLTKGVPHVIGLSGTPIKNNADEYFTILNILKPERFPNHRQFQMNYVNTYDNGWGTKAGGLKDPEWFKERTKDFIIRRTQDEVMPDLPKMNRQYRYAELGPAVEQAYGELMEKFAEKYNGGEMAMFGSGGILEYMTRMRKLTGLAKVEPVVDYVTDFLTDTDRKIVIFRHHDDVHTQVESLLATVCQAMGLEQPIALTSDLSPEDRHAVVMQFKDDPKCRVMIASTLASGEGLNLQFCSDCIIMERQWNPANEEQAEARFKRIGSEAAIINAVYQVALGTIDEYLADLVESKRQIVHEAYDGKRSETDYNEQGLMKELAEILVTKGMKRWKLQ